MRLMVWLWRRFRPAEGRFVFLLLVLAALNAAVGGIAAGWVPGDELFWHTALVGVLVGRRLGHTQMRRWWAALLLAVGGAIYVGWWVIHLTPPLWAVLGAAWPTTTASGCAPASSRPGPLPGPYARIAHRRGPIRRQ